MKLSFAFPVVASTFLLSFSDATTEQPWEWNGWNKFPSHFFAANLEEQFSTEQEDMIGRFALAIIEFRHGQFVAEETSGEWADGDSTGFMDEQARLLKERFPDLPVLTYKSALWSSTMFQEQRDLLYNKQSNMLDSTTGCDGFITYPLDIDENGTPTPPEGVDKCYWNFDSETTRTDFIDVMLTAIEDNGNADGIFFDNGHSIGCDRDNLLHSLTEAERLSFMEGQNEMLAYLFQEMANRSKYPIFSTTNGLDAYGLQIDFPEEECAQPEDALLEALEGIPFARNQEFWMWQLGDLAARQIENTIAETREYNISVLLHQHYFKSGGGCLDPCLRVDGSRKIFTKEEYLQFGVAAFLIVMGPGSYYSFDDAEADSECGGWCIEAWEYYDLYDDLIPGDPLGPGEKVDDYVFSRVFTNGNVTIDVARGTYELNFPNVDPVDVGGDDEPQCERECFFLFFWCWVRNWFIC